MKKKVGRIFLLVLTVTIYLNFGWMMGAYYSDHAGLATPEKITTFGKFMMGADDRSSDNTTKISWCILSSFLWPVGVFITLISWIIYGCYYIGWFVFAGGAVKLLGLA